MKPHLSIYIILLLSLAACKKGDSGPANYPLTLTIPADTTGDSITINSMPLHTGYHWTYKIRVQTTGFPEDSATYSKEVTRDTVINGIHVYHIVQSAYTLQGYTYPQAGNDFAQLTTGLYPLSSLANVRLTYIRDSIKPVLAYPLSACNISFYDSTSVTHTLSYGGCRRVTVPAATFNCVKIKDKGFRGEMHSALLQDDSYYFCEKGLVRITESSVSGSTSYIMITDLVFANF